VPSEVAGKIYPLLIKRGQKSEKLEEVDVLYSLPLLGSRVSRKSYSVEFWRGGECGFAVSRKK